MVIYDTEVELESPVGSGSWGSGGRFEKGNVTTKTIRCEIQPLDGYIFKLLPEGKRDVESLRIFTKEKLSVGDSSSNISGDVLIYNNKRFDIWRVHFWILGGLTHYEGIALREDK